MKNTPPTPKRIGRPKAPRRGKTVFIPADLLPAVEAMLTAYRVKCPKIGTPKETEK